MTQTDIKASETVDIIQPTNNISRKTNSDVSTSMQEFLKLIITITTGFLAFTVTFSEKLYNPNLDSIPGFLFATWIFMGLSIAACLFALGALISHLDENGKINKAILLSNIAYFLLFVGVAFFVTFAVTFDREKHKNDLNESELTAKKYIQLNDSTLYISSQIIKKKWNEDNGSYNFTFASSNDTVSIEVDPKHQTILSYER